MDTLPLLPELRVRAGRCDDAASVANLILMCGPVPLRYVFGLGDDTHLALNFFRQAFHQPVGAFSYRHTWVVEAQGTVVAAAVAYGNAMREQRATLGVLLRYYSALQWVRLFYRAVQMALCTRGIASDALYISNFAVLPHARHRGVATLLLRDLLTHAAHMGSRVCQLHVMECNTVARHLYARHGFRLVRRSFPTRALVCHAEMGPQLLLEQACWTP